MRISVDPTDPGYRLYRQQLRRSLRAVVLLDGVPVFGCYTADTKRGTITRTLRRPNWRGDAIARERLTGRVEIQWERRQRREIRYFAWSPS